MATSRLKYLKEDKFTTDFPNLPHLMLSSREKKTCQVRQGLLTLPLFRVVHVHYFCRKAVSTLLSPLLSPPLSHQWVGLCGQWKGKREERRRRGGRHHMKRAEKRGGRKRESCHSANFPERRRGEEEEVAAAPLLPLPCVQQSRKK